ncbi:MAG: spore germination protein GerW family protein [Pseudomonadota bacterium]
MDVKNMITRLLDEMHHISKTETVVGEPLVVGNTKLIPISKLSLAFGVGGLTSHAEESSPQSGQGQGSVGGAGGGIRVEPVAFVAVDPSGRAQLLCLDEPEATVIDKLLTVAPELAERLLKRIAPERAEAALPGSESKPKA